MTDKVRLTSHLLDILKNRLHMCLYSGWADRVNNCLAHDKAAQSCEVNSKWTASGTMLVCCCTNWLNERLVCWTMRRRATEVDVVLSVTPTTATESGGRLELPLYLSLSLSLSLWWTKEPRVVAMTVCEQGSCKSWRYRHETGGMKSYG